jgi:Protein of unknown function (DUF2905)
VSRSHRRLLGDAGRLPGDIAIERGNFTFYFPIVTCLIVSYSPVVGRLADEPVTSRILPFVPEKRAASGPRCRPRPLPPARGHRW